MKDSDNIQELYDWVNSLYEKYSNDEISEEEYLEAYNFYTKRKEEIETIKSKSGGNETQNQESEKEIEKVSPDKVRSTSIAGLRKKLMEEMKK